MVNLKAVFCSVRRPWFKHNYKNKRLYDFSLKVFLKKYGVQCGFIFSLFIGMIFGSFYAGIIDADMCEKLDFLFITNLNARLEQNFLGTFSACFVSNFIFLVSVFLLGITPWGIPFIPFVCLFKGFGAGITGGFLFSVFSLKGLLFYLIVLFPGIFIFSLVLVTQSCMSFSMSKRLLKITFFKHETNIPINGFMAFYCQRGIIMLLISFLCAVLDTLLWCSVSPLFLF